jgi:hypothetical protein
MATYAKLGYNGKVQTVALFEGLNTEELTSLLKTVFSIEGTIVGIMAEVRRNSVQATNLFTPLIHHISIVPGVSVAERTRAADLVGEQGSQRCPQHAVQAASLEYLQRESAQRQAPVDGDQQARHARQHALGPARGRFQPRIR